MFQSVQKLQKDIKASDFYGNKVTETTSTTVVCCLPLYVIEENAQPHLQVTEENTFPLKFDKP